jgi:phosphate-selective porin
MFDPIKTSAPLQDVFITLQPSRTITVDVGQQKVPLGFEGTQSSGRLDTAERALLIADKGRGAGCGDVRDLGVVTRARLAGNRMEYAAGVFNGLGESVNDIDRNEDKAVAARALFRPAHAGALQVGGSLARGTMRSDTVGGRTRSGVEMAFSHGPLAARSEWITGRDGLIPRRGYYVQGSTRLAKPLDAVFRADVWDPDTRDDAATSTVSERDWLGGVNWRVSAQTVLLQVNYARKTFRDIQAARNALLVNLQTNW